MNRMWTLYEPYNRYCVTNKVQWVETRCERAPLRIVKTLRNCHMINCSCTLQASRATWMLYKVCIYVTKAWREREARSKIRNINSRTMHGLWYSAMKKSMVFCWRHWSEWKAKPSSVYNNVQLRIDDLVTKQRYYVGIRKFRKQRRQNQATRLMTSRRLNTGKMSACSRSRNGLHSKGTRNKRAQGHHWALIIQSVVHKSRRFVPFAWRKKPKCISARNDS